MNHYLFDRFHLVIFLCSLLLTIPIESRSQIGITQIASPKAKEPVVLAYDSMYNQVGPDKVQSYQGQILYALPHDYCGFGSWKKEYQYAGHYFIVDSVVEFVRNDLAKHKFINGYTYYQSWLFYMTDRDDSTLKTQYTYETWENEYGRFDFSEFPFIVMSHYNFLLKNVVGKQIITRELDYNRDIITGDTIIIPNMEKKVWTCHEISILGNKEKSLVMIVKSGNQTSAINLCRFNYSDDHCSEGHKMIYFKSEWDKLVSTYGYGMVLSAFREEIKVGMPVKLLIYSWGEPSKINYSSYGQQWIYFEWDPIYVYIRGGKITSWN